MTELVKWSTRDAGTMAIHIETIKDWTLDSQNII